MWKVFAIFEDLGEQTWLDNEKARRTDQNWTYCRINGGWKPSEKLISFALFTVWSFHIIGKAKERGRNAHAAFQYFQQHQRHDSEKKKRKQSNIEPEIGQQINNHCFVS